MPQPAPFKLPQVSWKTNGVSLLSFRRDALEMLGVYLPGEGAVVIDPLWTRVRSPEAIAHHETQHQSLMINTTFGILTQLLFRMAEHGFVRDVLRKCLEKQWCVHELTATYAEMSFFAARSPEFFVEEVRKLPSARLDQPPYREVFEAMNRFLPVDPRKPKNVLGAQEMLVVLLASAAMNSDCLLRIGAGWRSESALLASMEDSPSSRCEQIINLLVAKNLLAALLVETVEQLARPEGSYTAETSPGSVVFERIVSLVPEVAIQSAADFFEQATQANIAWRSVVGADTKVRPPKLTSERVTSEPLPKIMESPEREQQLLAAHPPQKLLPSVLRERLTHTVRQSLGLTLELGVAESEAYVTARSYFVKRGAAPEPASQEEWPTERLPRDLGGLMSPAAILRELDAFPVLPHVAIFIDESWRNWHEIPGARERFRACIQVCRQTHLSHDDVLHNILRFEDIGDAAEFFVLRLRHERYVACFFNRRRPLVYALQKIATDFGLALFSKICNELGATICRDPRPVVPHVDLLTMVAFDYHF